MADDDAVRAAEQRNMAAFQAILPDLLRTHDGHFVLLRDGQIVQFFNTDVDAMAYGDLTYADGLYTVLGVSLDAVDQSFGATAISARAQSRLHTNAMSSAALFSLRDASPARKIKLCVGRRT